MRAHIPRTLLTALAVMAALAGGGVPAAAAEADGFPVSVENCGMTLTFDEPPSRVVAYVAGLDALIELGVSDAVIGRTHPYEEPATLLPGHAPVYAAIPEVSDGTYLPVKEELLALDPDLVIASDYSYFDPEGGYATREELADAGIPSFVLGDNCTLEELKAYKIRNTFDDVTDLGAIFGATDRADEVVAGLEARVADIQKRVAGLEPLRVVTADVTESAFYAPGSTVYEEVVELAGGHNVFDGGADGYGEVSLEEVAAADAQAYVIIQYLPDNAEQRIARIEAAAPDSEGVREHRYALVQNSELWVGIRVVNGLEKIAKVLHPDAFE